MLCGAKKPTYIFTEMLTLPHKPISARFRAGIVEIGLAISVSGAFAGDLPNPILTPGAVNPEVTQENIHQTICVKGWTKTIRPPASYTNKLKKKQIAQYGYADTNPKDYEEDHLIPLSIGGSPSDPRNLWPEPRKSEWSAGRKDSFEFAMYKAVCLGEVSLNEARRIFSTNWIEGYKHHEGLLQRFGRGHAD